MKITIESTTKRVQVETAGGGINARVWEGETDSGIKVVCLIARIAVPDGQDQTQFASELQECKPPSKLAEAYPLRLIL